MGTVPTASTPIPLPKLLVLVLLTFGRLCLRSAQLVLIVLSRRPHWGDTVKLELAVTIFTVKTKMEA